MLPEREQTRFIPVKVRHAFLVTRQVLVPVPGRVREAALVAGPVLPAVGVLSPVFTARVRAPGLYMPATGQDPARLHQILVP